MKKILTIFLLLAAVVKGDVLLWQVDETTTVDGGSIYTFLSPYVVDEDNWNAARVKVTGGNLSEPIYLPITYGPGQNEDGAWGVEICENESGYWGGRSSRWNSITV